MRRPDGLVDRLVEKTTGRPARPGEANTMFEYFRVENEPDAPVNDTPAVTADGEDTEVSIETLF